MKKTAGEIAALIGGTLYGDSTVLIDDVAVLFFDVFNNT